MSLFRITIDVPLTSESHMAQAEQLTKLKAPLDLFRKALAGVAPEHEYMDELIKPRAPAAEGAPRRGRKPKLIQAAAAAD